MLAPTGIEDKLFTGDIVVLQHLASSTHLRLHACYNIHWQYDSICFTA